MKNIDNMLKDYVVYNQYIKASTYSKSVIEFYDKYSDVFFELNDIVENSITTGEKADNSNAADNSYCEKIEHNDIIKEIKPPKNKFFGSQIEENNVSPAIKSIEVPPAVQNIIDDVALDFAQRSRGFFDKNGKQPNAKKMLDINLYMVMYVFPGIIATKRTYAVNIAETIAGKWNETFKNSRLSCSDYDTINAGFRRKLCYITTAVCDSLGKPDDCMELTMLREFRDEYMMNNSKGRKLVEEYYENAPAIVSAINTMDNSEQIYKELYNDYIFPCIKYIKRGQMEDCMNHYLSMIKHLA